MAEKKSIKVNVIGRALMIKGFEAEEYMLKVAAYINGMNEDYEKIPDFHHTSDDIKYRMIMLNLADDYFKERANAEELDQNLKDKINELDTMKHDYVNKDYMLDNLRKELEEAKKKSLEQEKTIFELQTELKSLKKELERLENHQQSGQSGFKKH